MSVRQVCTQIQNGVSSDLYNIPSILGTGVLETPKPLSNIVGSGVYLRPIKWYQVIPLAPDITLIATNQTPVQGGFLTLNLPDDPLLINGLPVISLDCHRVPGFQSVTAQAGTIVFQINGFMIKKSLFKVKLRMYRVIQRRLYLAIKVFHSFHPFNA